MWLDRYVTNWRVIYIGWTSCEEDLTFNFGSICIQPKLQCGLARRSTVMTSSVSIWPNATNTSLTRWCPGPTHVSNEYPSQLNCECHQRYRGLSLRVLGPIACRLECYITSSIRTFSGQYLLLPCSRFAGAKAVTLWRSVTNLNMAVR